MVAKAPLFLTIFCLLTPWFAAAQDAAETSVVVLATKARGGPNLRGQVRKRIEKKLKNDVQVVSFRTFKKAARRAGIKGRAAFDPANAVEIGTEAGVTHVCYIEGQRERDGRKKYYFAEVKLIEVASGDVVFTNRYALKGRKINAVIAGSMLEELTGALTEPPPPPPEPEPEPEPEPPPPPPDAPPPVEGDEPVAVSSDTEVPVEEPAEEPPVEEAPAIASLTPSFGESAGITVTETVSTRKRKRWRPALHVGVGGAAVQRNASTSADDGDPPGYEGPLPGAYLRLEFFPMAIGGRGDWFEGFGVHAEAQYMRVETIVDEGSQETVNSDVVGANGGLSFRLVFWDSVTAPDFTFKAGYGLFIFPLKKGAFPGTRYAGPYAGGHFTIPFIEQLALIAGGHATFLVQPSGKLKRLGDSDGGIGFRAEGGLRLFLDPFELVALFRFEQWGTSYSGETTLNPADSPTQYNNVSLTDRMLGGFVTAGVAF